MYAYLREYCQDPDVIDKDTHKQEEYIRSYCEERNLHLDTVFVDKFLHPPNQSRPGLIKLFTALKSTDTKKVIVYKLDVLSTDFMLQEEIIHEFMRIGVELISVKEPDLCRSDVTRMLMKENRVALGLNRLYRSAMDEILGE